MRSGPGESWVEKRADGWYACEVGGGYAFEWGPYRWKWRALWAKYWLCD